MAAPAPARNPAAPAAAPAPAAGAKPKSRRLLWFIVIPLVVLALGGCTWYVLSAKAGGARTADKPAAPLATPIYYKFDPAFVVNFGAAGATRFLQIGLEAMARDPTTIDAIKNNEPAIRNDLILLYSSQDYDNLVTVAGKERLRAASLATIRKVIGAEGGAAAKVEAAYFTSFVIQ